MFSAVYKNQIKSELFPYKSEWIVKQFSEETWEGVSKKFSHLTGKQRGFEKQLSTGSWIYLDPRKSLVNFSLGFKQNTRGYYKT